MLRITRQRGQSIRVGEDIEIKVLAVEGVKVVLGVRTTDRNTRVTRIGNGPKGHWRTITETAPNVNVTVETVTEGEK